MSKRAPEEAAGERVPVWIISFADMITLLLSFFVMLQTMSKSQDFTLFGISQDSFRRAIAGLGLPDLLLGKQAPTGFDYKKLKYPTEEEPNDREMKRIIDADDERIRQLFEDLKRQMEVEAGDLAEEPLSVTATPVKFAPGQSVLDDATKGYLGDLVAHWKQNLPAGAFRVYVIGLAREQEDLKQQWLLSARRSTAVGDFLRQVLGERPGQAWEVQCRGSGPGQELYSKLGLNQQELSIVIAVMGVKKTNG